MSADTKQHHICFAYHGDRMRASVFERLHFQRAEGTSLDDGMQLVRISLDRKHGRRTAAIPKLIEAYNQLSNLPPISPVPAFGTPDSITCFKIAKTYQGNGILSRIEHDNRTGKHRYWLWTVTATEAPKPRKRALLAGLENLVRELNLDPSSLCMQSAYDEITKVFFQVKGVELKNSGAFPSDDKEFILTELRRHFDRQRMYIVSPPAARLDSNAVAITDASALMSDLPFKDEPSQASPEALNATMRAFLQDVLPKWQARETVLMPVKVLLAAINKDTALYRKACLPAFLRPLVANGAAEWVGDHTVRFAVRQAGAVLLEK